MEDRAAPFRLREAIGKTGRAVRLQEAIGKTGRGQFTSGTAL